MTDSSPGPGWWLASDGNWYPPHLHPDALARATDAAGADDVASSVASAATERTSGATSRTGADSDADILAAYHITAGAPGGDELPLRSPLDEIRATTGGGIDWEAVARERAAQREMRARQAGSSRRKIYAVGGAVLALVAIALIARTERGGDDDASRTVTSPTVVGTTGANATPTSPSSTASDTSPSTSASPSTTLGDSGATGAASGAGTSVSVFGLAPGSCIDQDDLTTGLVTTVLRVACDEPHTHEVYFKTSVSPADQEYDAAKVTEFANQACTEGFAEYVGLPYEQSKYYFLHLAPSAESWNKNGDRDVVCLLLLEGQKLTTSVKGKNE